MPMAIELEFEDATGRVYTEIIEPGRPIVLPEGGEVTIRAMPIVTPPQHRPDAWRVDEEEDARRFMERGHMVQRFETKRPGHGHHGMVTKAYWIVWAKRTEEVRNVG